MTDALATRFETSATHADIVDHSAHEYRERLRSKLSEPRPSPEAAIAISTLIDTLTMALGKREHLTADDISFHAGMLTPLLATGEWEQFRNPYTLGGGNAAAPVVVMGTEEAYDPVEHPGIWNESNAILWLSESPLEIVQACAIGVTDATAAWRNTQALDRPDYKPYHRHPSWTWQKLDGHPTRGRHTWKVLAECVGVCGDLAVMEDFCYQMDRSAAPAKEASKGAPPTKERLAFTTKAISALRATASVLILHGHTSHNAALDPADEWNVANRTLTVTFLGIDDPPSTVREVGTRNIRIFERDHRIVLWARALNGAVSKDYTAAIHDIVRPYLRATTVGNEGRRHVSV